MKKRKINWFKLTSFAVILIILSLFTCLIADFIIYPECYITTWKYQFKNEILNGNKDSIDLYENIYVKNNRDVFKDNFEIRNTYNNRKVIENIIVEEPLKINKEVKTQKPEVKKQSDVITKEQSINIPQHLKSLGIFTITAYCPCYACSEGYGSQTATNVKAKEGVTIAVDPKVIPYGTKVIIDGKEYIAQDCGGAIKGNKIDIYFDTHAETDKWGKRNLEVFI